MYCEPPKTHPLQPNMWKFYYCINHSCCLLMGPSLMVFTHRSKHFADDLFQNDYSNGKSTPIKSAWNPRQTILKQFVLFGFGTPFLAVSFVEVQINVKIDECCFSSLHRFCFTNLSDFKSRISMQKKASSFRASHIHKISEFIIFNMIFIILKIFVSTVPTICWLQLNVLFFYSFNCRQSKKKKKNKTTIAIANILFDANAVEKWTHLRSFPIVNASALNDHLNEIDTLKYIANGPFVNVFFDRSSIFQQHQQKQIIYLSKQISSNQ